MCSDVMVAEVKCMKLAHDHGDNWSRSDHLKKNKKIMQAKYIALFASLSSRYNWQKQFTYLLHIRIFYGCNISTFEPGVILDTTSLIMICDVLNESQYGLRSATWLLAQCFELLTFLHLL